MKSRWIVYRELPRTDRCVTVDTFHDETDARGYCDMRNRTIGSRLYFVSLAMNND